MKKRSVITGWEIAKLFDVSESAIAKWESLGLLKAVPVTIYGLGYYDEEDVLKLKARCVNDTLPEDLMTLAEVMELFGVSRYIVCNWISKGRLNAVLVLPSGKRFFDKAEVMKLYEEESNPIYGGRKREELFSIKEVTNLFKLSMTAIQTWNTKGVLKPVVVLPRDNKTRVFYDKAEVLSLYEIYDREFLSQDLMTTSEVAAMFHTSPAYIYNWYGKFLKPVKFSKQFTTMKYYRREEVEQLYNEVYDEKEA